MDVAKPPQAPTIRVSITDEGALDTPVRDRKILENVPDIHYVRLYYYDTARGRYQRAKRVCTQEGVEIYTEFGSCVTRMSEAFVIPDDNKELIDVTKRVSASITVNRSLARGPYSDWSVKANMHHHDDDRWLCYQYMPPSRCVIPDEATIRGIPLVAPVPSPFVIAVIHRVGELHTPIYVDYSCYVRNKESHLVDRAVDGYGSLDSAELKKRLMYFSHVYPVVPPNINSLGRLHALVHDTGELSREFIYATNVNFGACYSNDAKRSMASAVDLYIDDGKKTIVGDLFRVYSVSKYSISSADVHSKEWLMYVLAAIPAEFFTTEDVSEKSFIFGVLNSPAMRINLIYIWRYVL
jgi:hypothetical protein